MATTLLVPVIRYKAGTGPGGPTSNPETQEPFSRRSSVVRAIFSGAPKESPTTKATRKKFATIFKQAVKHTRHYRGETLLAEQAGIMEMSSWLPRVPRVELLDYLKNTDRFQNQKPPRQRKRTFVHPHPGKPKTAVLADGFRFSFSYSRLDDYRNPRLARLKPESIAGPIDTLRALARGIETGHLWIPPLKHSVVAFAGLLEGPVSEEDMELFWRVFQVPVYEQFYGFGGELLAWECEAHQGLHINHKAAVFEQGAREELLVSLIGNPYQPVFRLVSGLSGTLVNTPCACGLTGPRIFDLMRCSDRQKLQKVIPMAATAS